jgi:hypothetical protein
MTEDEAPRVMMNAIGAVRVSSPSTQKMAEAKTTSATYAA